MDVKHRSVFLAMAALIAFCRALLCAEIAFAQATTANAAATSADLDEIIVTAASRIDRPGFVAPTPTTVVDSADILARAATSMKDIAEDLPSLRFQQKGNSTNDIAATYFNLRGLGADRTLVLVDGQRFVPTTTIGVVDSDVIPAALVDHVEVVTGGASAQWGSDAIGGVVNIVLKKNIDGFVGSVQAGETEAHDNKHQNAALAWGTEFGGGKGHVMLAIEYDHNYDFATQGDRDWASQQWGFASGTVSGTNYARILSPGITLSSLTDGGVIVANNGGPLAATSPLRGIQFGSGGTPIPYAYGTSVAALFMNGGDGGWVGNSQVLAPGPDRADIHARTSYDFDSGITGILDFTAVNATADYFPFAQIGDTNAPLTITAANPYLATSVKDIMAANGITSFGLGRIFSEIPNLNGKVLNSVQRISGALNGNAWNDWKWSAYATVGTTRNSSQAFNSLNEANMRAAADVISSPTTGLPICNPATVAALSASAGCVPANYLGVDSLSQQAIDYITGTAWLQARYWQYAGGTTLSGEPFSVPGGKVSVTGGIEVRRETLSVDSDPTSQDASIAFPAGGWQQANGKPLHGGFNVGEAFVETVVPLLPSMAFSKSFDFDAAVRNAYYSSVGDATTWKLGLIYQPIDGLRVRGAYSHDLRAPTLNELYTSVSITNAAVTDFGRAGNPNTAIQDWRLGNTHLKPETADTSTLGIAWQSRTLGLSASLDYYNIKVSNVVAQVGPQQIVNFCYGKLGSPLEESYCADIVRNAAGAINYVNDLTQNVNSYTVNGVDIELAYDVPLERMFNSPVGSLHLGILANDANDFTINNGVTKINEVGQVSDQFATNVAQPGPKWRVSATSTYNLGAVSWWLEGRFVGSGIYNATYFGTAILDNTIASSFLLNSSLSYTLLSSDKRNFTVFGRVNNLLNRDPPIVPNTVAQPWASNIAFYDLLGRAYEVGFRFTL
jgi:iron complex outermembrane recepter protein